MGLLSRQPTSNDLPPPVSNPWGPKNSMLDDVAILLTGKGERCQECKRVVLNRYLVRVGDQNYCPDHAPQEKKAQQ